MSVTLKQVRAFVAVAQVQSFAEACDIVHLSQPALSIAIRNLEESVGGKLLSRTTRALALTPEGEAFYPVAKRLLLDWDEAMEDLHQRFALNRGKVSIAAMPSFASNLLPVVIARFRQHHPEVKVRVDDVIAEAVVEAVSRGRVEIGISLAPEQAGDLRFEALFCDRFIAAVPADHPALADQQISAAELVQSPLIQLQRPSSVRVLIERALTQAELAWQTAFEAHQFATVGRMVASGLGVSIVPSLCRQQMEELGARCLALTDPLIEHDVGVLVRKRYPLSAAASAFYQLLLEGREVNSGWDGGESVS